MNASIQQHKKTRRPLVLATVVLSMFMAAIEGTIVATAMPSIVGDLGGFSLYTWVFSAYLLMQAVTIPIYGKLADLFGRKPVFTFGVIVFLIGSVLCGFAQSMTGLILFRFIQGLGAGAVQPIATTIVGDIYTMEERAKIQGYLSSVWGISSVIGPLLGGILVVYVHWSWVFWVNIPIGILSVIGIWLFLHEEVEKKKRDIDYIGSSLLLLSISALMVILIQGGVYWEWTSWPMILLFGLFVTGILLFVAQESRASEPMMPLWLWKQRLIMVANLASLTGGAVLIGVSSFLPAFVQGVMERSPTIAGFTLSAMSIGWPIAAAVAGRLMIRIGFRTTALLGGLALIIGAVFFIMLTPEKGPIWAGLGSFFIGVGMGLTTTTFIVSIQSSVDWKTRGVATASNMFMRILGSTIGAAVLGAILNRSMRQYLADQEQAQDLPIPVDIDVTNMILDPVRQSGVPDSVLHVLQDGLTISLENVYWGVLVMAVLSILLVSFLPQKADQEPEEKQVPDEEI